MNHNLRVGQRHPLALGARAEQESTHGGGHAHGDGGHITLDVLHGVVDGHARSDAAAGAVDIELDILVGILSLQVEQLGHNQAGSGVVDLLRQEDDAVVQQTGKNIIAALAAAGLLNNIGNQTHGDVSFHRHGLETF